MTGFIERDPVAIKGLIKRVEEAHGVVRNLGTENMFRALHSDIVFALTGDGMCEDVTHSVDAAVELLQEVLPGWWWRVGSCYLTDDATVGPDYANPDDRERLFKEFPMELNLPYGDPGRAYDEGFDCDLGPATGNCTLSLLGAMLKGILYTLELRQKVTE